MQNDSSKLKKISAGIVFLIILLHFVKDVVEDVLGVQTPWDIIEDISHFPEWLVWVYHWAMVNTVVGELILILLLPKYLFCKISKGEKKLIVFAIVYIITMFTIAYLLS